MITRSQSPQRLRLGLESAQLSPERLRGRAIDRTTNREARCEDGLCRHNAPGTAVEVDLDPLPPASAKGCNDGDSHDRGYASTWILSVATSSSSIGVTSTFTTPSA